MLNNIRKTADSFIMRVLFAMIVFAFVGFGIKDVLHGRGGGDIVTFSHAKNISQEDFLRAKSLEINAISKQVGVSLTEEEIAQLNIDNRILKRLVFENILDYLVSYYDFDISDDTVKNLVKESPVFKNDQGIFDIKLFKTYFRNSYTDEEKYLVNFKEKALKNIFAGTFLDSFYVPKAMTDNIVNYMAEKREVELVQMNLQNKPKDLQIPVPSDQELKDFYQNNKSSFEIPEKRSFSYIKVTTENLQKKIQVTKEELLEFYNENKEEFGEQSFEDVQKQLREQVESQKIDILNMELAKNLEDDVAAGSSLVEIAEKYELPINNINNISYADLIEDKIIAENADSIFELSEGELSYPIEAEDKSYLVLVELKSINPAKIPEFDSIKEQINSTWIKQYLADLNIKIMKDLAKEDNFDTEDKTSNAKIRNKTYIRSEMENDQMLTPEILLSIFNTQIGANTPVFQVGDDLYFAHIKSTNIDEQVAKNIRTNSEKNIVNTIKNSIIDELINYTIKQNDMKVKTM
ncbi:peptidylprolyl isomerase [Rickettsia bellii]|uniref:Parvulin-like peptidyl-prolyl isomerase n=3 Tax=Rickettsia bellii TaxID=33990 RepID=Q1RK62_RICBR|nr:SurA N-terminal domain-containing protein [Rickettsia bellii]ABE04252.1 Parvulin-like peptidyl-prolyl isomerase [Rickettsia bellii RML369-C]ARD85880.1 peptidylprolyl isomerase [Rickettsia bellii]KJV89079.1 surA N-terminal domain protein [Rickettsia bellii str. RML An4]KJV92433.1 surA N-terminal domain protein [Rickettsia bellii str. RML Mogi]